MKSPSPDFAERRLHFLVRASQQLQLSLDPDVTARTAASIPVPAISDVCVVELVGADGRLTPVARAEAPHAAGLALASRNPADWVVVPLEARGRYLGALHLSTAVSGRRYGPADQALAEDFAARTALALDNALLHQRLEEALRQRDEFLLTAAHDLNTPLTALKLQTHSLMRGSLARSVDDALRKRVASIDRQVDHLSHMVGNLLHGSRLSVGELQLAPGDVDLAALGQEVAARFEAQAAWVGSALTVEAPAPVWGRWDRTRLDEVVTNLVSNALKYGGARPIAVRVERVGARARLSVRDHGIGIAPERLNQIWQKFGRTVGGREYPGFGLGLWIVKRLVEAMDGTVAVESRLGEGSTFTVELPSIGPAEDDPADHPPRPDEDPSP